MGLWCLKRKARGLKVPYRSGSSLRTVCEDASVMDTIDRELVKHPRLQQVYDGLKYRLARWPDKRGVKVVRTEDVFMMKTPDLLKLGIPTIRVLYTYDDNEVNVIAVDIVELI